MQFNKRQISSPDKRPFTNLQPLTGKREIILQYAISSWQEIYY